MLTIIYTVQKTTLTIIVYKTNYRQNIFASIKIICVAKIYFAEIFLSLGCTALCTVRLSSLCTTIKQRIQTVAEIRGGGEGISGEISLSLYLPNTDKLKQNRTF